MPDKRDNRLSGTRREMLAGLSTVAGVSMAGCTTLPAFGQQVRFGSVDPPATNPPDYRNWIPEPESTDMPEGDQYISTYVEYLEPGSRGADLLGAPYGGRSVKPGMDDIGVAFADIEWAVATRGSVVARVSVDADTVDTALADTGYSRLGSYEGFDLYERSDLQRTIGVGEDVVVFAPYITEPTEHVERYIDAGAGRLTRRYESDAPFSTLTDSVQAPPWMTLTDGDLALDDGQSILGSQWMNFDDTTVYAGRTFLFPEDSDVTAEAIRSSVSQYPEALDATRVEVTVDGAVATAVAQLPPERLLDSSGFSVYDQPIITWGLDWTPGDDTAVLTHEAGDTVAADVFTISLQAVAFDSTATSNGPQRPTPVETQFSDSYDRLEPGDSLAIDVSDVDSWQLRVQGEPSGTDYSWRELTYLPPSFVN